MARRDTQGHSAYTPVKQGHFSQILRTHIDITQRILNKKQTLWPEWAEPHYLYIDAYAGSGTCNGELGSPLIFLKYARFFNLRYKAHFIDTNPDYCETLRFHSGHLKDVSTHTGDNADILENVLTLNGKKKQFGLFYADPNGIPCFNAIKKVYSAAKFDKLDILINLPATAIKRAIGSPLCSQEKKLDEHILEINKSFWIIRVPYDRWQWTFLLGTNWDSFPEFSHLGFHRLSSPAGLRILEKMTYTAEEISKFKQDGYYPKHDYDAFRAHPFTQLIRREVLGRSAQKKKLPQCERCKVSSATEVHHLKYPKWEDHNDVGLGFDRPENLVALCHRCHCKLEGKER